MKLMIALVLLLSGCTFVDYGNTPHFNPLPVPTVSTPVVVDTGLLRVFILTQNRGMIECKPFALPDLPDMPPKPVIPPSALGNKEKEEDILVQSIAQHREVIHQLQAQAFALFSHYVQSCLKE